MRKIFHRFFTIVSIVVVSLLLTDVAKACSCVTSSLDWEVENAANIVVLKLQSVEKYKKGEEDFGEDGIKQSKLIVQRVFKGNLKIGKVMTFEQGGGADCIWGFSQKSMGKNFLFYLPKTSFEPFLWKGNVCSRSASLESAAADLLYLEKLNKVRGKTRLSGKVTKIIYPKDFNPVSQKLVGIDVRIIGNGRDITGKTNKDGVYEFYGLPVGKYKLILPKLKGYRVYTENDSLEIEIEGKGFVEKNIEYLVE